MDQTSTTAVTTNHHRSSTSGGNGGLRGGDLSTCCFGNMMDTLFVLGQESRLRILQQAASRVPACAYICVWGPIPAGGRRPPPPFAAANRARRQLLCLDAWLRDGGSGDVDRARALFDAYRGSLCAAVSGCVPGWAYEDGRAYMELPEHDLATSASSPVQLQFYQEAGIKVAAFMGCESGEIEVGMSTPAGQMNLQAGLDQIFSENFFQQSLLEELLQLPPTRPSSSSSSMPSISVGSPTDGSTSLLPTMAMSSSTTTSPRELTAAPLLHPPRPPHPAPFSPHGPAHVHGHVHFPSPEADDVAMAQAMLAVISASSSSSSAMPPTTSTPPLGYRRAHRSPRRGSTTTAFRAYNAALAPRAPRRASDAPGQRMIKMVISILRRMHTLNNNGQERTTGVGAGAGATTQRWREEDEEAAAPTAPTSSQLHHMISERRRRERLNESFEALRGLLPPGSKKDKATVLANTLDYMNILIAQISDLQDKNRSLEAAALAQFQQHQRITNGNSRDRPDQAALQAGGASKRVQVEVATGSAGASTSSSSFSAAQCCEVTIRVAAAGDLSDLVARVLALLKDTAGHRFTVVAVDARQPQGTSDGGIAQASLILRATVRAAAGEFDEEALREAVTKAVVSLATPPSSDEL
ncbi:putative transcription factor bHLH041 [Hordeum vulgare subsp. vulgare]|uniref:BHLH domain-containing protein n=2 Tax=Hordeum vulgare subsp. vulgare TaxID=112509 RepID=A0A8I6YCR0_HORVV|nr:putative transcription factor bHLH041 [Hordeum vulgare subsp. vulgare]